MDVFIPAHRLSSPNESKHLNSFILMLLSSKKKSIWGSSIPMNVFSVEMDIAFLKLFLPEPLPVGGPGAYLLSHPLAGGCWHWENGTLFLVDLLSLWSRKCLHSS